MLRRCKYPFRKETEGRSNHVTSMFNAKLTSRLRVSWRSHRLFKGVTERAEEPVMDHVEWILL